MSDNDTVLVGNLTRDIDLRYSDAGHAYARTGIAVNRRRKQGDDWVDETSFFDLAILDDQTAQNASETLGKGDRVLVSGRLEQRTVEDDKGEKRSYVTLVCDHIAVDLRFCTASIVKNPKKNQGETQPAASGGDFFDTRNF